MAHIIIKNHEIVSNDIGNNITLKDNKLTIPKNTQIKDAIKISLINDSGEQLKFVVEENSDVNILLEVVDESKGESSYNIDFETKANTNVKYLLIANLESENANINHDFKIGRDSNTHIMAGLVSEVLTAKLNVEIIGQGANVNIRAIALSNDNHDQKIDVYMHHRAPHTNGDMTCIGIAGGNGKVILNGIEKIDNGMKHCNVYQTLRGIITSDDSRIEVNPILLIEEYDLYGAGHAATVGKLDQEALYYLMSRGLTKRDSEKLIINGFVKPLLDEIEDEELNAKFSELVNKRIWLIWMK